MKEYFRPELLPLTERPAGMAGPCYNGGVADGPCSTGGTAGGSCIQVGSSPYA